MRQRGQKETAVECQGGVVVDDRRPPQPIGCRVGCRENRPLRPSTTLYIGRTVSRVLCRALQLYSSRYASTALQLYSALHSTTSTPTLWIWRTPEYSTSTRNWRTPEYKYT